MVMAIVALIAMSATASAEPSRTTACTNCHSGVSLPVTTTLVNIVGTNATYSFSSPGADAIAVFSPTAKIAAIEASSGQFTVTVGQTYTVYSVGGPGRNDGVGSTTVSPAPLPDPVPTVTVEIVAGATRYHTAVTASARAFPSGADCVVIATGANWPDALGGGALASAVAGPILLTETGRLPDPVAAEIARLGATRAYVLGGKGAVDDAVFDALEDLLGAGNVTRIGGADRFETANLVSVAAVNEMKAGAGFDGTAFVATGANFPDALAAAPLSVAKGWPLFLAGPNGLSAATTSAMAACGITDVIVLGGTGVVSGTVESGLKTTYGNGNVTRLYGASRYHTAAAVAAYGCNAAGLSWDGLAIATGTDFPDALAGGVLQGVRGSVMLLTDRTLLSAPTASALGGNKSSIEHVTFLGGTGAVSQSVRDAVAGTLQ
jgi:putative cell wall-binding protein